MRNLLAMLILLILPVNSFSAPLPTESVQEFIYRVSSRGVTIGELLTKREQVSGKESVIRFSSHLTISVNLLFMSYQQESRETAEIGPLGLFHYRRTTYKQGKEEVVEGIMVGDSFQVAIHEDGRELTKVFRRSEYDLTTMELPETLIRNEGEDIELRLLDVEKMSIVTRHLRWLRSERIMVRGSQTLCRVIAFEDQNKRGTRWLKNDLILRQDGVSELGSYQVMLREIIPATRTGPVE